MTQLTREQATRPQPTTLHPNDAALEALAEARAASVAAQTATDHVLELLRAQQTPAELHPVTLTAAEPYKTHRSRQRWASFGIYNPSGATIYAGGMAGVSANPTSSPVSVPSAAALVLPVSVQDIEFTADPAVLAAGNVVFYLLRFHAVQPVFFGAL